MKIEKWNSKTNRFEQVEATDSDIEDLFYIFEYSKAEASIEETKQMILQSNYDFIHPDYAKTKKN